MTYLAVPISAPNPDQAADQISAAVAADAEMLELRADYLENLSVDMVENLVARVKNQAVHPMPIIVTCRDKRQGGAISYPMQLRVEVLIGALKTGAEFVDFEYENFLNTRSQERIRRALSLSSKGRLILSAHNFQGKFENITRLHRHILTVCPSAIPKLVCTANHINDCFDALDSLQRTSGERIVFCMGQAGLVSRILAKKLGSFVTFASIDEQTATAPGQLTIRQLKDLYRYDSIDPDTQLFGVIADPVGHSLSPVIHNACFARMNMNRLYLPLLVQGGQDKFDSFMRSTLLRKWLHFRGFSVTIPHKENALRFVKQSGGFIEPLAEKIGAVNTLIITTDGRLKAYNTDYAGALNAITAGMGIAGADLSGLSVAVIGAGGVARAIVAGLTDAHAKIRIYNRTVEKGRRLARDFGCESAGLHELPNLDARLIINCTSIGMHPNIDESPLPDGCLTKDMTVFDTVYNPAETLLLKQAKQVGCRNISGLDMFVNQAAAQFKLFTGANADPRLMRKTVGDCLMRQ